MTTNIELIEEEHVLIKRQVKKDWKRYYYDDEDIIKIPNIEHQTNIINIDSTKYKDLYRRYVERYEEIKL